MGSVYMVQSPPLGVTHMHQSNDVLLISASDQGSEAGVGVSQGSTGVPHSSHSGCASIRILGVVQ